jgi:hypothetical protein
VIIDVLSNVSEVYMKGAHIVGGAIASMQIQDCCQSCHMDVIVVVRDGRVKEEKKAR